MKLEFEWHAAKAAANVRAHGVSFDLAKTVFSDPFAIERLDDRADAWRRSSCHDWHGRGKHFVVCSLYRTRGMHPHYFSSKGNPI
jgi:uncharacterized DUF497 family protein